MRNAANNTEFSPIEELKLMYGFKKSLITAACAAAFIFAAPQTQAETFNAEQKAELNKLFEAYLMENPEIIMKSVEAHRSNQEKKATEDAAENIKKYQEFYSNKGVPMAGNPDGDVTLVEYFDYNCGYCKRLYTDLLTLLEEDKNLRVVFQDMPILAPSSALMAKYALAAHKQNKYFEMHKALMDHRGGQTEDDYNKVAEGLGLNMEQLKKDMAAPEIEQTLATHMTMAQSLGIQGAPGIIIGDQIYKGYIGLDGVKQSIKEVREKKAQ